MITMRASFHAIAIIALFSLAMVGGGVPASGTGPSWLAKVDPLVLSTASEGETEFLLFLSEQADLSDATDLPTKEAKGEFVFRSLTEVAARTQAPILEDLAARGTEYRPYWIANLIWVRGGIDLLSDLAKREEVARVYPNPKVRLDGPLPAPPAGSPQEADAIEWNILKVRAPEVWDAGFTGQGIVVGGQDTGYAWEHPALQSHYRGWDGASADHNYSWHDSIHDSAGNPCGNDATEPCDDYGHGTHTMGTMVGEEPDGENQVGMAPGAEWIGCRNMDQGVGTPATYSECYQWFVAPTDLNGENPDPSKAPHVINNSWACPPSEGCNDPEVLQSVVEAVRAAGILTVHSAGNSGPACGTIDTPAAIYDASFTVGNTTQSDEMALSSSRGPVTVDGSGRLKPDVSAPGTWILSSYPGGIYVHLSGTSMAGPHVAGLAALLFSARPDLIGQIDEVEDIIRTTAVPVFVDQECGEIPGDSVPNNTAGWGRIDAWSAYSADLTDVSLSPDQTQLSLPGWVIAYTHQITNTGLISETFDLSLMSSQGWGIIDTAEITLDPGETADLQVLVTIPIGSSVGLEDLAALTASSREDPSVSAAVMDITIVGVGTRFPFIIR